MVAVDFGKLMENLSEIPKEDEYNPDDAKELKVLFLVLAGDQRVIRKLTLEDMAGLFDDAARLLGNYANQLEYSFKESALEDYADAVRRAV